MKQFSLALTALLLCNCSLVPDFVQPKVETPATWSKPDTAASTNINPDWWTSFNSAELNDYMNQALAANNDLQASLHRIEQARANLKIAGSSLWPSIGATAGASDSQTHVEGAGSNSSNRVEAGGSINYELDLFGANRAGAETAEANLEATQYNSDALKLVVMSDTATGYFSVLSLRERLTAADHNLENAREILRIAQARYDAGRTSALELSQQQSELASTEAAKATLEKQLQTALNALAVLVGKPPQTITVATDNLTGVTIPAIAPGQPSSLLERRPDIAAAEANLKAANANIGAARAAFFPSITLGLNGSLAAASFGNPVTSVATLASSLAAPIFEGGRLEGGLEQATAQQKELVETYRKTVLVSFREVEDALAAEKAAAMREQSLQIAKDAAQQAYNLSKLRYDAGSVDFQTLLDSQRTLLSAEDAYVQSRLERLSAAINLYKALGGGWK